MKRLFCCLVLAFTGSVHGQSVFVVDLAQGPGSTHRLINDALADASDGDFILVRPGYYPGVVSIVGLSITIQAESGGSAAR